MTVDERYHVYHILSRVLTVGIITSIALMIFGYALLFLHGESSVTHFPPIGELLAGVLRLDASSVIWFATLVLIFTPIARVVTSIVLFIYEHDRRYFLITVTVLILLSVSFLVGIALS